VISNFLHNLSIISLRNWSENAQSLATHVGKYTKIVLETIWSTPKANGEPLGNTTVKGYWTLPGQNATSSKRLCNTLVFGLPRDSYFLGSFLRVPPDTLLAALQLYRLSKLAL
jgi:hypothetical protein